jgi:Domain of Unknown Function (DUF1080)
MSSAYPLYGSTSAQPCQRCGMALPPNEVYCRNCGYYNPPAQSSSRAGSAPANVAWGTTPAASYGPQNQYAGQQWGQPSPPAPLEQNNFYGQAPVPQLSFDSPAQQSAPNNSYGPVAPTINNGNYYAGASQQGAYNAGPATPQQQFYSPTQVPGMNMGFQQGTINGSPPMIGNQSFVPRSKGPNRGLIVGIILLLVVLVGGGIASYVFIFAHRSAQITQTSTVVSATPTPQGPPLFADAFNSNTNGWDLQGNPGKFSVTLGNGALALQDNDNKLLWELVPGNKTFRDFKLSIDAVLSKGEQINGYGVYIRGSLDQNSNLTTYYRFELYGDGTYAVFKGNVDSSGKSTPTKIVDYTSNSAIQKQGGLNHIVIIAKGSTMVFMVNGQALKTVTDSSYTSGSLALFVSNVQNAHAGAVATFSHFAVYPSQV